MSRGPDAATATLTKRVFDKKKKKTVPRIMDRGVEETRLSTDIINSLLNLSSSLKFDGNLHFQVWWLLQF